MSKYFITGGYGFLGQYIVQAIHDHDSQAELRVLVRSQRKTLLPLAQLARATWVTGDLTRPESFQSQLEGVETVIHSAALVSFSPADRERVFAANVLGTRHLADAALQAGCRNFIFISSISALDVRPPAVMDETFEPDLAQKAASDIYGYTKRLSEIELGELKEKMRVIILNPSVILGPGSERVEIALKLVRRLPFVPMVDYVNAFVDVRDVAQAVTLALSEGRSGERYIVSAYNARMIEFMRLVVGSLGKKTSVLPLPGWGLSAMDATVALLDRLHWNPGVRRPAQVNVDKACSSEKIRQEMGWMPVYSLEESLRTTVEAAE